jgi:hypothetical protein
VKTPPSDTGWNVTTIKEHFDDRLRMLHEELVGFPETYARQVSVEAIRQALESVREDHVGRREFDEIRSAQQAGNGRRTAMVGALGVVLTLGAIMFGQLQRSQITHADVTAQIRTEAPWASDRPGVENELRRLAQLTVTQSQQIVVMRQQIAFFCRTRTKAGLPGC